MGGVAHLSGFEEVRDVNSDMCGAMDWNMVSDLSPREVKAAAGPELETTATLFFHCVFMSGRGSKEGE